MLRAWPRLLLVVFLTLLLTASCQAQEASLKVQADQVLHRISQYLTGACIEDVNHEIYGGIYSQMIFGESFQEPPPSPPIPGFKAYGGQWRVEGGEVRVQATDGPKLVSQHPSFGDGEVGVELKFDEKTGINAGLVVRLENPGMGADRFHGYEVSLEPVSQKVMIGRHRGNWEPIKDAPCEVAIGRWIPLKVKLQGATLEVFVDGKSVLRHEDDDRALLKGGVSLRAWHSRPAYRNLWIKTGDAVEPLPFEQPALVSEISGMWRAVQAGTATGQFGLSRDKSFVGGQSQVLAFKGGSGRWGVENQGLNRWGLNLVAGKPYQGYVWVRSERPAKLFASLESKDGLHSYAEVTLAVAAGDWQRLDFTMIPTASDTGGRFALTLGEPATVELGHAFLQPGEWGRFQGLPVRKDVAEGLINQGITVLRYGGSMINKPGYLWKKMIGPRDRRPPYDGTWYAYSTNGWGIIDFMNFCEAAGFEYIPAFHMNETPQDMSDFMEYAMGPADSPWGQKRVADGHPEPYKLRYLELGNEERVDEAYAAKFEALAKAIWARDSKVTLVVGDFVYSDPITDPLKFTGAASGITSLAGQHKILQLAKTHGREVWFDLHIATDGPGTSRDLAALPTFIDALAKLADGAKHKVVVFEYNSGNHSQRRALGNALATNVIMRDGRLPIVTSANCLQPDGQNDNDWDQGLLFLNPSQVWLQPPGYVTQMQSRNYLPDLLKCEVSGGQGQLDVVSTRSEDGKTLVLQVVNLDFEHLIQ